MVKVLSIIGTRPEAIKMSPVVLALQQCEAIVSKVCLTGQHRQMSDPVLALFGITADYDLDVIQNARTPIQVAAAVMEKLEPILHSEKPDWLLVQGDTTTVAAASLAAFYAGVQVGHVEAGLRTYDKQQPFPEEVNRRVASVIADLHFAPTQQACENLYREGIAPSSVLLTGNPVIDALHSAINMPCNFEETPLCKIPWHKRIILVTAHRRENFGAPLSDICNALKSVAECFGEDTHIVYPVHLNPNVKEPVYAALGDVCNITLTPPLDYLPLVHLLKNSHLVVTDSGGLQEEAPSLGKPVLVLRNTTERPEALSSQTVKLIGTDYGRIVSEVTALLTNDAVYRLMSQGVSPYGDGNAAARIVSGILGVSA